MRPIFKQPQTRTVAFLTSVLLVGGSIVLADVAASASSQKNECSALGNLKTERQRRSAQRACDLAGRRLSRLISTTMIPTSTVATELAFSPSEETVKLRESELGPIEPIVVPTTLGNDTVTTSTAVLADAPLVYVPPPSPWLIVPDPIVVRAAVPTSTVAPTSTGVPTTVPVTTVSPLTPILDSDPVIAAVATTVATTSVPVNKTSPTTVVSTSVPELILIPIVVSTTVASTTIVSTVPPATTVGTTVATPDTVAPTTPSTNVKPATSVPVTTVAPVTTVKPATTVAVTTVPATTLPVISGLVVNVRSEGATGNGGTDDTDAIQRASDKVRRAGGGTVLFPAGTYLISNTVHIYPGVTYEGTGNPVIQAKADYPKDTRMFTTESFPWVGTTDSPYLIVRGLTFDGNSSRQGAYKNYENEHSFLLYLTGNPTQPGRLRALVENTTVRNGVADGISVFVNADVQIRNVRGDNLFRGAVTMTGGYSKLDVNGLTTTGDIDRTGIDIETDGRGYGATLRNESTWRNLDLDGDLDFQVYDGSTVTADNIHMRSGPIFIGAMDSTITINNSTLAVGMADSYLNRIVAPHNVTFNNTTFTMTQQGSGPFYGIDIYWQLFPTKTKQQVTCNTCTFTTDNTINNTTPAYGFYNRTQATTDTLTLNNTTFTPRFTKPTNSS